MKNRCALCIGISVTFLLLIMCSNAQSSQDQEDAMKELKSLNIIYDQNTFIDYVFKGNTKVIDLFLRAGMNPNVHKDGLSALDVALFGGRLELVKFLLNKGADINEMNSPTDLLTIASAKGDKDIVRLFIDRGFNVEATMPSGRRAIDIAREYRHQDIVAMLMDLGEKRKEAEYLACGSNDSASAASPNQYKEVALRYLRALAQRDFATFLQLDIQSRDSLARMVQVPELPAFDRQQRMQNAINAANQYIKEQFDVLYLPGTGGFNSPKEVVDYLRGATSFKVVEVGPIKGGVAEVYRGRTNIFFVPVVYKNGQWGVLLGSVGIHGHSTRIQPPN